MPDPLIPRNEIALTDAGSYRVDEATLRHLDGARFDEINRMMTALMQANPTYEFMKKDDVIRGGFTIYWRRRKNYGKHGQSEGRSSTTGQPNQIRGSNHHSQAEDESNGFGYRAILAGGE